MGLLILPLMFLALWAIVILPQQRRMRAHQALVSVLDVGDEVMTTSGILGTITAIDDEVLHLEVAPGVTLRIVRGAVARRMDEPEPEAAGGDEPEDGQTGTSDHTTVDVGAPVDGERSDSNET